MSTHCFPYLAKHAVASSGLCSAGLADFCLCLFKEGFGIVCGSISVNLSTTRESTGALYLVAFRVFYGNFVLIHPGLRFTTE